MGLAVDGRLRGDAKHENGVGRDLGGERTGGFAEVLFGPQVADGGGKMPGLAEVFPRDGDIGLEGSAIEQHDGAATVLQLLGPDFGVAVLANAAALHAEEIVTNGDDVHVSEAYIDFGRHAL